MIGIIATNNTKSEMQNYKGVCFFVTQLIFCSPEQQIRSTLTRTERSDALFEGRQLETLRAAVDRIVPPDAETPGGVDAGALDYLLGQVGRDLSHEVAHYQAFLDYLETEAMSAQGAHFAEVSPEVQTAILRQAEANETQRRFFHRFVEHVQEGFYISPIAWGMIGWKVRG
jgi:hypothetical protein